MAEIEFEIKGKGKKGGDNSLTEIKFTSIKIDKEEKSFDDSVADHKNAKDALSELLSKPADEGSSSDNSSSSDDSSSGLNITTSTSDPNSGGSSHKRKSYKKEKKMKGGKRKSMRRHKHV